jgi:hypothetical protein
MIRIRTMTPSGCVSKYYSGVGSRETPLYVCMAMTAIARFLESEGYTLRSGGAGGADLAFEDGVVSLKDIYLPWEGFNGSDSQLFGVCEAAMDMAVRIHPTHETLRKRVKAHQLHSRNCYQVLGKALDTPSEFLICWTEEAKKVGGTRTAIILTEQHNIPVLNLGKCKTYDECMTAFETFYMVYG